METPTVLSVTAFGDPFCPWDFSAEPARLRLLWRYRDALAVTHRMVVLSSHPDEYAQRGVTIEQLSQSRETLGSRFGMPIARIPLPRHVVTAEACRAVVGVRLHAPAAAPLLLRRLRVLGMSHGMLIDEAATIARAAQEAGLDPHDVTTWARESATTEALAGDMADARSPSPTALAMPERLATTVHGQRRYTCPSYVIGNGGGHLDAPGFQPARVYEVLVANVAPHLVPHPEPTDVRDVLAWAPYPLATAEVAGIMETSVARARTALQESGAQAHATPGGDYWSPGSGTSQGSGSPITAAA